MEERLFTVICSIKNENTGKSYHHTIAIIRRGGLYHLFDANNKLADSVQSFTVSYLYYLMRQAFCLNFGFTITHPFTMKVDAVVAPKQELSLSQVSVSPYYLFNGTKKQAEITTNVKKISC